MGHIITLPCVVKAKRNETISDLRNDFRYLVEEYMGYEAANVFDEVLKDVESEIDEMYATGTRHPAGDDYEAISDGFRGLLVDTMNDLHEVLMQQRISRKRLDKIYDRLNKNV